MNTMVPEYQGLNSQREFMTHRKNALAIPEDAMTVLLEILRFLSGIVLIIASAVILLMLE